MQIEVGHKGFVDLVDRLGTDTTVVNAARVSFGKRVAEMGDKDVKLLDYLVAHGHTSPLRHAVVQLHVRAPEYVARQWYKHIIGSDYAFKDTAWNEISGRYVTTITECEEPLEWRGRADTAKQGSGAALSLPDQDQASEIYRWSTCAAQQSYEELLKLGVAPEQARIVLPMSFITEWYWTASLQAVAHFVKLRSDPHAQAEIRAYASAIDELMVGAFPKTWAAVRGACV